MSARETAEQIDNRATEWVARSDRGTLNAVEQAELDTWLAGDSRRQGAYLRAQALWAELGRERPREIPAHPERVATSSAPASRGRFRLGASLAAALVAAVAGIAFILGTGDRYDTALGEIRRIPLADGSVASLNTDSRVSVSIEPAMRRV